MTPEIEKQITSLIEAAKQTGSDAASFISQQAPDVIAQLIRWKIAGGVFDTIVGVVLMWAGYKLFRVTWNKSESGDLEEEAWIPVGIAVLAMCLFGFFCAYFGVSQAGKACLAPKVLVLETITGIAQKK